MPIVPEEGSGLPDDVDVTIASAHWGYPPRYMGGEKLALVLMLESDDLSEPYELILGAGNNFNPSPDGTRVDDDRAPDHKKKNSFNINTGVGSWLRRFVELEVVDQLAEKRGTDTNVAAWWTGMKLHCEREMLTNNVDPSKPIERLMPTAFLGYADGSGGMPAASAATPAHSAKLIEEAKKAGSAESFQEAGIPLLADMDAMTRKRFMDPAALQGLWDELRAL